MASDPLLENILIVMSLISFFVMGADKQLAKTGGWRISERSVWALAVFGGFVGIILGAQIFRHKTRKRGFWIPVIFAALLWLAVFSARPG